MRNPPVNLTRWVVLAAIMSVPLLLLGNRPLLERVLVVHIPASAIMFIVPTAVTVVEAYRLGRFRDVRQILGFARSDLGIVPGAIAIPFVATAVDQWIQGNAFPDNRGYMMVLGSIVAFMIAAALEELGWNAWLLRGLAGRTNVIAASLIVGGLWAIWHVIPWFRLGHSTHWVAGQIANTIAMRWFIGELSVRGNRWFWPAVAAHASGNLAWSLTADAGASYRPHVSAIGLVFVAGLFALRRRS